MTGENPAFIKRVKRQVSGKFRECFVATAPGFEKLTGSELSMLPLSNPAISIEAGGIGFNGRLADLMQANLHLRTATRILMRVATFKAEGLFGLQRKLRDIPWEIYLYRGQQVNIHVTTRRSRIYHSEAVAQRVQQSLSDRQRLMVSTQAHRSNQKLFVRIHNNRVTISIDSSGDPLFKRGLKQHGSVAPLRETSAAAVLQMAGYSPGRPLLDPMCGSGSFSLEAAMAAKNMAAGMHRQFAFFGWPSFQPRRWNYLLNSAREKVVRLSHQSIFASDKNKKATETLQDCIRMHNLSDAVNVESENFFDITPVNRFHQKGLVVLNPPYGVRLGKERKNTAFFSELASKLKSDFTGWQTALLVPESAAKSIRKLSLKPFRIIHGGLGIVMFSGKIT